MRRLRDALLGMLLASLPLPGGALDWQPIARTGEPAPGLPGETLYEVDAGFYLGLRPLVAADGSVRFRAWPASEAAGPFIDRLFSWSPTGASDAPFQPTITGLPAECGLSITNAVVNPLGELALQMTGSHGFGCSDYGALLVPDGSTTLLEIFPHPASDGIYQRYGSALRGIDAERRVLVRSYECNPTSILCSDERQLLHLAQGTDAQVVAIEKSTPAVGAGMDAVIVRFADSAQAGPTAGGAVVFIARVGEPGCYEGEACQEAVYRWTPDGGLELVALGGAQAPDAQGAFWEWFGSLALAGDGSLAFRGHLAPGPGVAPGDDDGIWIADEAGVRLAFRESPESGRLLLPILRNTSGALAFVTGPSLTQELRVVAPDGSVRVRARGLDPLPGGSGVLGAFELRAFADNDCVLLSRPLWNRFLLVEPDDEILVLADGDPVEFAPGDVRENVELEISADASLTHFALGARPYPSDVTGLFYATVPESGAAGSAAAGALALAWLRRRSAAARA